MSDITGCNMIIYMTRSHCQHVCSLVVFLCQGQLDKYSTHVCQNKLKIWQWATKLRRKTKMPT